jgi:16S rRNA (guanine1207-N2)-methyltransferase
LTAELTDLPRSTRALLAALPAQRSGAALDIGSVQGLVAQSLGAPYVHNDLPACKAAVVADVIHTDILPQGPFQLIAFDASDYEEGLARETVAQAAACLTPDGRLLTTARRAYVEEFFETVSQQDELCIGTGPRPERYQPEETSYQFNAFTIQTAPGIFSPRALDGGTALMLEQLNPQPGARFLDLGSGAGVVSKVASELWQCQVTAVDVSARALRYTMLNAPQATVLPSDGLSALQGQTFDLIASNPPYHTDFAVAKRFIEGAYRQLNMGGALALVVKRADWYVQKVRTLFGGCRLAERDGYTLILAEKRPKAPQQPKPETTTRKHAKRMAQRRPHK